MTVHSIGVIDFGAGNIGSMVNMLRHVGPTPVKTTGNNAALSRQVNDSRHYFAHNFKAVPDNPVHVAGQATYGETFCSAVDNGLGVVGYQFHPEKSHRFGMALSRSVAGLDADHQ